MIEIKGRRKRGVDGPGRIPLLALNWTTTGRVDGKTNRGKKVTVRGGYSRNRGDEGKGVTDQKGTQGH